MTDFDEAIRRARGRESDLVAQYERVHRFTGWVIVALAGVMAGFGLFVWVAT